MSIISAIKIPQEFMLLSIKAVGKVIISNFYSLQPDELYTHITSLLNNPILW